MKRNKHSLSHYRLLTADLGKLVPVACYEVLPGDTVQQATSVLVRVTPLMAPVMHPVSVRIHHWFVPHRLVWGQWENFITGGPDGTGITDPADPYPTMTVDPQYPTGGLLDYLGVVPGHEATVSALPVLSYNLVYNEFYRDQDLMPEVDLFDPYLKNVAWEKDYFTTARPWPQKGPDVSMPLGTVAPVIPAGTGIPDFTVAGSEGSIRTLYGNGTDANWQTGNGPTNPPGNAKWRTTSLQADLTNATAVNVNDVRRAFALQRYQEARARYGSRYTEYLRYLGVRPSDARLQRPEYLGGGKQTISFSEVLQTGPGSTDGSPVPGGVGQMAGHGIAAMRSRRYRRFFEEHGVVLSLLSVKPRAIYANGLNRMWSRRTKEDYWQKELEQIGQQEVYRREVYQEADSGTGTGGDTLFGYQDRYAEYKHIPSTVHAEFRNVLNYWHYGRIFATPPALNQSFVECDPTKRVYAEQNQDPLWIMASNSIQARRMVSRSNSSRIM